jgi:hypothetical protein
MRTGTLAAVATLAAALGMTASGAAPRLAWTESGAGCETWVSRSAGGEGVAQTSAAAYLGFAGPSGVVSRVELCGSRSASGPARLGPRVSGSALVSYRWGQGWRAQFGAATPSGLADLDGARLALGRRVGEPLLAAPDPDPARGWRLHAGVLWARALQRGLGLTLGAGCDVNAAFHAAPALRLDPGERLHGLAALEWSGRGRMGRARVTLAREGAERASGLLLRGGRMLYGLELGGALEARAWRLAGELATSRAGSCRVPDPLAPGVWLHPGPGSVTGLALSAEPRAATALTSGWAGRPALRLALRTTDPGELAIADGWMASVGGRVILFSGAREIGVQAALERGRARGWEGDGVAVRGWRCAASVRIRRPGALEDEP